MNAIYGFDPTAAAGAVQNSQQEIVGRAHEITMLAVALLAGQNVALVGPPGTAKTHLGETFGRAAVGGDAVGVWQVHPQTTVSDVCGEIDMAGVLGVEGAAAWSQRLTGSLLDPRVHLAIIDEVFKASNATLSGFLRLLQDGIVRGEDGAEYSTSVLSFVGLSNEFPAGTCGQRKRAGDIDMTALWDRFHLRKWVSPLRGGDVTEMLLAVQQGARRAASAGETGRGVRPEVVTIPDAENYWRDGQRAVLEAFSNVDRAACERLAQWADALCDRGVYVSNRTVPVMLRAACAHAVLHGRSAPTGLDFRWAALAVAYEGPESLTDIEDSEIMDFLTPNIDPVIQRCASEMADILASAALARRESAGIDTCEENLRRFVSVSGMVKSRMAGHTEGDRDATEGVHADILDTAKRVQEILNGEIMGHFDTPIEAMEFVQRVTNDVRGA